MKNKRNKLIISLVFTIMSILSVGYFSCEKTGIPAICVGVKCQNGGYCLNGQCMCPNGYEDSTCSTSIDTKYIGTWRTFQTVVTSDSSKDLGMDSVYDMYIKTSATRTTFFFYNFLGNFEYNKVVCSIDPTNSYKFSIDTVTNAAMRFASIHFWGGSGKIHLFYDSLGKRVPSKDTITGGFVYKFINNVHNWQVDTIKLVMTPIL